MAELSPRAQSAEILRNETTYTPPLVESLPEGYNTVEVLGDIKPLHYAKLAQAIDVLLDRMVEGRSSRATDGFVHSEYCESDDPWVRLRANTLATVHQLLPEIEETQPYREAESMTIFIGRLDSNRFIHTGMQLMAGADTATSAMLTLLRNIPSVAMAHGFEGDAPALEQLARDSHGLVFRQAMTCVDRMMAAQAVLAGHDQHESWALIDKTLEPDHFKLVVQAEGPVLRYVNFPGLLVPAGYKRGPDHTPISSDTQLGSLECYQDTIIGCPITLLKGRMQQLWNWYIDVIAQNDMWNVEQTPCSY